ncbi:MAG: hypothetical protein WCP36_05085 [Methanomicrobiales archaeon]
MTRQSVRIATTHQVSDHQCVTLDDLKQHLDTIDHVIIPVYSVHDPRQPPIGRVISGVIVGLDDGEYALDVNVELFGPDFIPKSGTSEDKRVVMVNRPPGKFGIWCNTRSSAPEKAEIIQEISNILGTPVSYRSSEEILKEELPILIIGIGMLPFGYLAGTFSRRLDGEKVHQLEEKVTLLFTAPGTNLPDSLLIVDLDVTDKQKRSMVIEVIMTNPPGNDIRSFFSGGLGELDRILPPYFLSRLHPKKIVMNYRDGKFRVLYAIQKQGIPMIPRSVISMADR